MKIWQRYLFGFLIRSFFFFLVCISFFYIVIDFSMHGFRVNYVHQFSRFTPLFFSLSFLLALLKVLLNLSSQGEIGALQIAGLSLKKLLLPFFFFAALLSLFFIINYQWISPEAKQEADNFYKTHSTHIYLKSRVFSLILQDGSELVYQKFDPVKNELFDVFWLCSFNEIWHVKYLSVNTDPPIGFHADHFLRVKGSLEKSDSCEERVFSELSLEKGTALQSYVPFENRSLSTLWQQSKGSSQSLAHLHYKLAQTSIPFLIILLLAPLAIHSRTRQSLALIALALFTYIGLMTLLDAMLILAENQVVPAKYAIWTPLAALSSRIGWKKLIE